MRVRVVGAGVIGLSCAVRLREAGIDAHVVATEQGPHTTSAAAAALWYPYRAGPPERVRAWGRVTYQELHRLAALPATGVVLRPGVRHLRSTETDPAPPWAAEVAGFQVRTTGSGPYRGSWTFDAPVADTTVYLQWLVDRLTRLGGDVATGHLGSVAEALAGVDLAVLATGLGARTLPGDRGLTGRRGQVVLVRAPQVRSWVLDEEHPAGMVYVVPRRHDVVCGGVDTEVDPAAPATGGPDPAVARAILRRCTDVVPELAGAEVVGHRVGVRPVRSEVRLERAGPVVYCYGHGGAGFTLSWGCADDVRDLVLGAGPASTGSVTSSVFGC